VVTQGIVCTGSTKWTTVAGNIVVSHKTKAKSHSSSKLIIWSKVIIHTSKRGITGSGASISVEADAVEPLEEFAA